MEQFATEDQQVEAIKRFWKDNGTAIIVGAVLGLGGLWGWRYYSESQLEAKAQASSEYQTVIENATEQGNVESVREFAKTNADNGYGDIAALIAARQLVEQGDLEGAAAQFKLLLDRAEDSHLSALAGVRLARLQIEMDAADKALVTLDGIKSESFAALVAEIRGDAYVKKGQADDARMAYTKALESDTANQLVKMKLDNLSVATGS
ncbi:YfgM family protein [Salinimonas chungwhensis]|uniref:YfgM family protein n=1 Tax=Salinimonas chungwhensis TaxID=265425 RepID=UPI000371B41F|nr:tetratricopeptide repeat protein [Salinimonas chungwhensis]